MPPALACKFTTGELAVLRIVGDEVRASGLCGLCIDAIAARAGVCRRLAQSADEMMAKTEDARGPYAPRIELNFDPAIKDYVRTTTADAQGNFVFDKLSSGDYRILTCVRWAVPSQYVDLQQGGEMVKRVTVAGVDPVKVILSC